MLNEKQRDALKLLCILPPLLKRVPNCSVKKRFAVLSELSILSGIDGLDKLAALSKLSKLS